MVKMASVKLYVRYCFSYLKYTLLGLIAFQLSVIVVIVLSKRKIFFRPANGTNKPFSETGKAEILIIINLKIKLTD